MSASNFFCATPPHLQEMAKEAAQDLLPTKSKEKYESVYDLFVEWRKLNKTTSTSEHVLLAYLKHLSETQSPSSLWNKYSMLKKTLLLKEKVDIGGYGTVIAFLKKQSVGFQPKKSSVFTKNELHRFLNEAPDLNYLAIKVAFVIGIMGACRGQEISDIKVEDMKEEGDLILVTLPKTKTNKQRQFAIKEEFTEYIKKYRNLRPKVVPTNRFFLNYKNGKCTTQVIGKHTISAMPKLIATFLKLKNPELYTGHAFRRTSATIFSNEGGSMLDLKDLGGWESDKVAQGYIQNSVHHKIKISNVLTSAVRCSNTNTFSPSTNVSVPMKKDKDVTVNVENKSSQQNIASNNIVINANVVHIHNHYNN